MTQLVKRRIAGAAALVIACILAVTLGITPASAFDGRVPDSRSATAQGEITAQYWHGLNRDPDTGGLNNYMSFAKQNCRWGVLDASFKILNSAEAHNTWRNNPRALAGMLYAALLNRAADPGGLTAYTNAIRDRGLPWATAQMMGSPEYRNRLGRFCTNSGESATEYDWQTAQSIARNTFFKHAENLAIACGVSTTVKSAIGALKSTPYPPAVAVGKIASVTNMIITGWGLDGTCGAAVAFLRAGLAVNSTINGDRHSPVFIQWSVGRPGLNGQRKFTIRVGSNPTSWTGYSGSAWG
ncbi:hypothetical protein OV320_2282 [Actinobacteria bacterium OV320]|uniref:hypothetical protein n=1 Tax=Streptomyces sp. NBC_00723 TaxID=2903673 RepID=UPI0006BA7AB4|nr:hypothetical protein OV320_2282 [Actinobacteria bacterium OV320]